MSLRVSSIEINEFRGIPQKLIIDFHAKGSKTPVSMILSGDNGVGKSSIVDAIEFVLQSRIGGMENLSDEYSPISMSQPICLNSYATIKFSDGSKITREITELQNGETKRECVYQDNKGNYHQFQGRHPDYASSPFTLRRSDILRFWSTRQAKTINILWLFT